MSFIAEMQLRTNNCWQFNNMTMPDGGRVAVVIGANEHRQWLAGAMSSGVDLPYCRVSLCYTMIGPRSPAAPRWWPAGNKMYDDCNIRFSDLCNGCYYFDFATTMYNDVLHVCNMLLF